MDPQAPAWRRFLLAQLKAKVEHFGDDFRGLVIDEPTAVVGYNAAGGDTDGNRSWCGDPCASQLLTWIATARELRGFLDEEPIARVMLTNQIGVLRADIMASCDGIFTEALDSRSHGAYMNALGLVGVSMPVILWTERNFIGNHDLFFQRHLLMGIFPMAPAPGNDHSVQPTPTLVNAYLEYGPLFKLMIGAEWALAVSNPVIVKTEFESARANAFVKRDEGVVLAAVVEAGTAAINVDIDCGLGICGGSRYTQSDMCTCAASWPAATTAQLKCFVSESKCRCQGVKTARGGFVFISCAVTSPA